MREREREEKRERERERERERGREKEREREGGFVLNCPEISKWFNSHILLQFKT